MPSNQKIGFIGMGKMATAIAQGLLSTKTVPSSAIYFYERTPESATQTAQTLGIIPVQDISTLIQKSDVVFLCVKPQNLTDISHQVSPFPPNKILISILAGISLSTLAQKCQAQGPIIRLMPNTPAVLKKGITAICTNKVTPPTTTQAIQTLLNSIGETLIVDESQMDIITAISGSGPAFMVQIASDIAKTGVAAGLSEAQAIRLIAQTMIGAGHMLLQSNTSPETLIQEVSSKGGTTVAGLTQYQDQKIGQSMTQVIQAAYQRAIELNQESSK